MAIADRSPQFSFELHSSARLLRRNFDRRAKAHGLSRSRWQVLWHLDKEEGLKQAELAERMDIAPISLARQLDNLEQEGLVERRRDPEDKRCFRIHLKDAAQPVLDLLRMLADELRDEIFMDFSAREIEQLQQLLSRLKANLSREDN